MKNTRILFIVLFGILVYSLCLPGLADENITSDVLFPVEQTLSSTAMPTPVITAELPTDWYSCALRGATLSSEGESQKITLNLTAAGDSIDLSNDIIVFRNKGLQVVIETEEELHPVNEIVSGTVKKATIKTDAFIGEIKETSVKYLVMLEGTFPEAPPPDSRIKVILAETPPADMQTIFETAAQNLGLHLRSVSHIVSVQTVNLGSPSNTTITMSVSPGWVTTTGRNTVRIIRVADDGTIEILKTEPFGYDQFGNNVFVAESPHGFSTFGLISILEVSESPPVTTTSSVPATSIEIPATSVVPLPANPTDFVAISLTSIIATVLLVALIAEGIAYLYLVMKVKKMG
jgi:hypothetical protein